MFFAFAQAVVMSVAHGKPFDLTLCLLSADIACGGKGFFFSECLITVLEDAGDVFLIGGEYDLDLVLFIRRGISGVV